ncbi:hypothetical protein GCM10011316_12730 [Roseibium aquae]|uniref:DUF1194 domain-containing protein n=1 Tax=Roseibium aquae TaxID=1323746 RepID=A0A916TFP6_9HYPH|nr:DUF1194 domain-containing protein [Roseibium aquae]GGB42292.1 hypothetical protein GCM10011316_12730 [Roseibium aquae]
MKKWFLHFPLLLAVASLLGLAAARAQEPVDVALVLAVDVSLSMSYEEMGIQRSGYAAALTSDEVLATIAGGFHGRIAVTFFEWANNSWARELVGWTIIETREDAEAIAKELRTAHRRGERRTSISGGIEAAMEKLENLPFEVDRKVIDISGDGPNNQGVPVTQARDEAIARGITINGLPLLTSGGFGGIFNIPDLDEYYRRCVIGGPASFMIPVNSWDQFPEAVRRKLVLEIGAVPPADLAPVIPAQITFGEPYDCLIGEKLWQQRRMFLDR